MKIKKKAILIFAAVLVFSSVFSFSSCGSSNEKTEEAVKVGCMYRDSVNDVGVTKVMDECLTKASEKTGAELIKKERVPAGTKEASDTIKNFIDQGCKVIVCCSSEYSDAVKKLAETGKYDDVVFLTFKGDYQNGKNAESFSGSMEEARYLSGMACAAVSRTKKLGYVATDRDTEVQIGINAFVLGAQSVDPDARVYVRYINTRRDEEKEKKAALRLVRSGCDVLTYHADTIAVQLAAKNENVFAAGWNIAENMVGEKYVTSPYWDFSGYFTDVFKKAGDGTFKASDKKPFGKYGSIKSGMIKLDDFGERVPSEIIKEIDSVREKMANGDFRVFSGEIVYTDGRKLCKKGETLNNEEIWKTDGEVKGVVVEIQK